jgi:hypothetical protein
MVFYSGNVLLTVLVKKNRISRWIEYTWRPFFVVNLISVEERYRDELHCLNVDGFKSLGLQSSLAS